LVDAQRRQLGVGQFDKDLFVLDAENLDLADVGYAQQFVADALGKVLQLRVVEAVCGQRINVAKNVAEFVVEERPLDAGRQGMANVADLLAYLVENVRHRAGRRAVLGEEQHGRFAGAGVAGTRSIYGVSCSFFSILSVSCCSTWRAVAPGQKVRMTMILKVKGGSSAWLSRP
jgi:hypothetical protein